jgi:hypothetical protein
MGDEEGDAELLGQRGAHEDDEHDVGGRHRQAHPEDEARDQDEEEGEDDVAAREGDHHGGELEPEAGQAHDAHDDARDRAGHGDGDGVPRAEFQRLERQREAAAAEGHEACERRPGAREGPERAQACGRHDREDGVEAHAHRRIARDEEPDERHERQEEVPALGEDGADGGELGGGQALHPLLHRSDMDEEVDRAEIEEGREDRDEHDVDVRDARELGHQERARAHEGRHDLPARGGRGLDPARLRRAVAELLHERDGEGARGDDVGDGRSADRAHAGRGDDGGLGRAAPLPPRGGIGEVDEELARPCHFEEGAEEDEDEDEGGRDAERQAEDAFGAERHLARDAFERVAAVVEDPGHPVGEKRELAPPPGEGIGDEDRADDRHPEAHRAPRGLEHDEDRQDADPDVDVAREDLVGDDVDVPGDPGADEDPAGDERPSMIQPATPRGL